MTYLSQLPPSEIAALASQLTPPVRAQLADFMRSSGHAGSASMRSSLDSPGVPQPRTAVPVPTPLRPRQVSPSPGPPIRYLHGNGHGSHRPHLPAASHQDPDAPLLSVPAVQAVLATFSPAARRYMRSLDSTGRHAATAQRELQQVSRFSVQCEDARQSTEADRARLYRVAQQQQHALVTSAARLASMQTVCDEQRKLLREERERSRTLERGLRAMAREASWGRDALPPQPVGAIGAAWEAISVVEELPAD